MNRRDRGQGIQLARKVKECHFIVLSFCSNSNSKILVPGCDLYMRDLVITPS